MPDPIYNKKHISEIYFLLYIVSIFYKDINDQKNTAQFSDVSCIEIQIVKKIAGFTSGTVAIILESTVECRYFWRKLKGVSFRQREWW